MRRIQFSIATLLFLITGVAILCVLAKWERTFPYWTILPGILFVCACRCARRRKSADLAWGRLPRTAHDSSAELGSAAITHPYHPLRDQQFPVLKMRRVGGVDTLILRGTTGGTLAVPLAWTDRAEPCPWQAIGRNPPLFSAPSLSSLVELLGLLSAQDEKEGKS
jgi:hypothetical protein